MSDKQSTRYFFENLYETYEQKIFYQAYSIVKQKEQAEDVTQDVFEQLYVERERLATLDELHLKKFIITITKNKAIDLYRRNATQIKYIDDYKTSASKESQANNVEEHLKELVSEEEFEEIAKELKPPYLQVFMYRVFYGFSTKEVALIMDSKEATIRKQFERAKLSVKTILGRFGYGRKIQ